MRRLGLFALLGLLVLATSTASATSLKVDAGVLQAWTVDVDLLDCEDDPDAPHCVDGLDLEGPWGISSTSATLCEGFEDASFCTGPSDQ